MTGADEPPARAPQPEKKLTVVFYRVGETGSEPVRSWLKDEMTAVDRKIIGEDILTVELGWPVGMPTCKPIGDSLWEVRSNISGKRIARVLFAIRNDKMILLHGFVKKTQEIPTSELHLAKKRKKEIG